MKGQLHLILYVPWSSSKPQNDHTLILLEAAVSNHSPDKAGAQPSLSPLQCSERINEGSHVRWENTETSLERVYLMREEKPVCLWWRNEIAGWLYKGRVRWKSCTQQRPDSERQIMLVRLSCWAHQQSRARPIPCERELHNNDCSTLREDAARTTTIHPSWLAFLCE